jgi:hypothetical protein
MAENFLDRIKILLDFEKRRYKKKYLVFILKLLELYFVFFVLPKLLFPLYVLLPLENFFLLNGIGKPLVVNSSFIIDVLITNAISKLKHPFFDQYKVNKEPWHWESDPISYKIMYRSAVNIAAVNLVIVTIINLIVTYFGLVASTVDPEKFPSGWELISQVFLF